MNKPEIEMDDVCSGCKDKVADCWLDCDKLVKAMHQAGMSAPPCPVQEIRKLDDAGHLFQVSQQ